MFKWFKGMFSNEEENKDELLKEELQKEILEEEESISKEFSNEEELELKSNYNEPLTENELDDATSEIKDHPDLMEKIACQVMDNTKDIEDSSEIEDIVIEDEVLKNDHLDVEEIMKLEDEKLETDDENNFEGENAIFQDVFESIIESAEESTPISEIDNINEDKKKPSMFQRLMDGLSKTRNEMSIKINTILGSYVKIDDELLEDLEDILISADIGMDTTMKLIDNLRESIIRGKVNDPSLVMPMLKEEVKKLMNSELDSKIMSESPTIILVVGVNGVGKTTTIGKMSSKFKSQGKKVLVAAGDTFRAAAIDQLKEWGKRADVEVICHNEGSDPASVIFDAISASKSRKIDVLICDTAGRLHNKANLMRELEKINKIIGREYPDANRETLLVLDATTGQNAMNQAKIFNEVCDITGIVLTKLDGTAKGGVVIALQSELSVPIKLIGVGEGIEDLQVFNIDTFLDAIFE